MYIGTGPYESPERVTGTLRGRGIRRMRAARSLSRVQRLYSMFPGHAPGIALLLLRVSIGAGVLLNGSLRFPSILGEWDIPVRLAIDLVLLAGIVTPWIAFVAGVLTIVDVATLGSPCAPVAFLTVVNALALGLLGPGAYSLDARIFGRRLLVLPGDDADLR